jgi:hypothetical protein
MTGELRHHSRAAQAATRCAGEPFRFRAVLFRAVSVFVPWIAKVSLLVLLAFLSVSLGNYGVRQVI